MGKIDEAQRLLSELEPYLKSVQTDIAGAERRLAIAKSTADNLEERNRLVIADINKQAQDKQAQYEEELATRQAEEDAQLAKAKAIKEGMLDEIENLNQTKGQLAKDVDALGETKGNLSADIDVKNHELDELSKDVVAKSATISDQRNFKTSLGAEIHELQVAREQAQSDLDVLDVEVAKLEEQIMELDAQHQARKEVVAKQITVLGTQLQAAQADLAETQRQDKTIRESWVDKTRELDKREQVVRRLEARLSGAEARIIELDNYRQL